MLPGMANGRLMVIWGCMFSGKSERLVGYLREAVASGRTVAAFKHASDDRYAVRRIVTHSGQSSEAVPIHDAALMPQLAGDAGLVAVDEAQFFPASLVEVCRLLVAQGREVVVAGLDLDSWGEPFGPMPALAALADEVVLTHATCARCGRPADHTQRLADVRGQAMVGGAESYEPRCGGCFRPPPPDLRC
jgi:thymidine kinase